VGLSLALAALVSACGGSSHQSSTSATSSTSGSGGSGSSTYGGAASTTAPLPAAARGNVYFADRPGNFAMVAAQALPRIYVPNSISNTVSVIDPKTYRVIATYPVGALPQHVTPSYDLSTLYVDNDAGNSLTPIDPTTGRPSGAPIPVQDPYNMYFTPDGRYAIVVAERLKELDFRDPHTMALRHALSVPMCDGVDHMDFSASGNVLYASCEFAGRMIEVNLRTLRVVRTLRLGAGGGMPQDVKLSPDGRVLYVADMFYGGVWEIDQPHFRVIRFLPTGAGAHGLYPSRDARVLYVSNRTAGSISVVSFRTRRVIKTWQLPLPASPDMGGVSSDGRVLWLSGRYNSEVYAINTRTGKLIARIPVGDGPHGLSVWPQPGRFSLGHTGIMR
jgi:YVTN family beta-propeller protein